MRLRTRRAAAPREQACSKCGAKKPFTRDNFIPAKACRDGLSKVCRGCSRKYHAGWDQKNRPERLRKRRTYYATREKHLEPKRQVARWEKDPLWQRAQIMRGCVRARVKELNLPVSQELRRTEWFAQRLRELPACPCCGIEFDIRGGKLRGAMGPSNASPTVDRMVPALGYVLGNVHIICWRCNNLKRDAAPSELEQVAAWMRRVGTWTT